jgi:hypothetical protein
MFRDFKRSGVSQCQNCLNYGHFTYQCTKKRAYLYRPSPNTLFGSNKLYSNQSTDKAPAYHPAPSDKRRFGANVKNEFDDQFMRSADSEAEDIDEKEINKPDEHIIEDSINKLNHNKDFPNKLSTGNDNLMQLEMNSESNLSTEKEIVVMSNYEQNDNAIVNSIDKIDDADQCPGDKEKSKDVEMPNKNSLQTGEPTPPAYSELVYEVEKETLTNLGEFKRDFEGKPLKDDQLKEKEKKVVKHRKRSASSSLSSERIPKDTRKPNNKNDRNNSSKDEKYKRDHRLQGRNDSKNTKTHDQGHKRRKHEAPNRRKFSFETSRDSSSSLSD